MGSPGASDRRPQADPRVLAVSRAGRVARAERHVQRRRARLRGRAGRPDGLLRAAGRRRRRGPERRRNEEPADRRRRSHSSPDLVLANQEENTTRRPRGARAARSFASTSRSPARGRWARAPRQARAHLRRRPRSARPRALPAGLRRATGGGACARRAAALANLLPDLDEAAHDDPRRHVHQRHARPLRRAQRLRRQERRYPLAADLGRPRRSPRRRSPAATFAIRASPSMR